MRPSAGRYLVVRFLQPFGLLRQLRLVELVRTGRRVPRTLDGISAKNRDRTVAVRTAGSDLALTNTRKSTLRDAGDLERGLARIDRLRVGRSAVEQERIMRQS